MLRTAMAALLVFAVVAATACSDDDSGDGGGAGRLSVVATTTQIGDFAANVGGERVDLTVLLRPNQDAHDFELEPSQIRAVAAADLVLRNGLELDAFVDKSLEDSDATVVTLTDEIDLLLDEEGGESNDPHVWFAVENAQRMVEATRDALVAEDGDNRDFYEANATAYLQALEALDEEIRAQVETVPEACRKLVTNHDVLGYYAAAYGFEVVGSVIPSTTTGAQASASDIGEIVRLIQEQGVPAVFAEASGNPALINQVGREAGVTVVDDLYGDSLGPAGSDGATYIDMMRSNTTKIVEALSACEG